MGKLSGIRRKVRQLGERAADIVSVFVGTWSFVFSYTLAMAAWIILHTSGVLHIDTPSFDLWSFWLAYFAGIQASILLMSSARQARIDRKRDLDAYSITRRNMTQLGEITDQIDVLESVLEDMYNEVSTKKRGRGHDSER